MSPTDFNKLMDGRKFSGRTHEALQLVLVEYVRKSDAAAQCGITRPTLSHALSRLFPTKRCATCGQPIRRNSNAE